MVLEDFGEIKVNWRRMKLAFNEWNRVIAFVDDSDGVEFTFEVFLSLQDPARKHPDWLHRISLLSDNERILSVYEKLLEDTRTAASQ